MAKAKPFTTVEKFLFETPLYAPLLGAAKDLQQIYGHTTTSSIKLDGYCPECERDASFTMPKIQISRDQWNEITKITDVDTIHIICDRRRHRVRFYVHVENSLIRKIGQWPSLADIAIDEVKQKFKPVLKGDNWTELYKAIGLAAHGEGIGSFVYLRRVFERLIQTRFDEFRHTENWDADDFKKARMEDRVGLLSSHLPEFLVENRRIYSIFSLGIHELENDDCLSFFEIGKHSIIAILEEDLHTKKRLEEKAKFKDAIARFGKTETAEPTTSTDPRDAAQTE